jgi:hypothetical protein
MPSAPMVVACVALFVALGGTAAAITAANANRLGGKPANDYLLKSEQPLSSTGLVKLADGGTKTLYRLADNHLKVGAVCNGLEAFVVVTPSERGVYHLNSSAPMVAREPLIIAPVTGGVDYSTTEFTTPQGSFYIEMMTGFRPEGQYHGYCIFDVRVIS